MVGDLIDFGVKHLNDHLLMTFGRFDPILVLFYYPIPPLGEWDLVFVWFHLPYYYTRSSSSSKGWSDFTLLLKLSQ